MFSIAVFLDRAKARASIDSDYRLAKVIGKNHSVITNYRTGISLPNEDVLIQLCALSGDDPDLIAAQIQAARSKDGPARDLWNRVALKLAGGVNPAILSVFFAISLIAAPASDARAGGLKYQIMAQFDKLYIVLSSVWRWLAEGSAPFAVVALLWFHGHEGRASVACDLGNELALQRQLASGRGDSLAREALRLAYLVRLGDFGAANDPLIAGPVPTRTIKRVEKNTQGNVGQFLPSTWLATAPATEPLRQGFLPWQLQK